MMVKGREIEPNALVAAARAAGSEGVSVLYGFVGGSEAGEVILYTDLMMRTSLSIPEQDVIHIKYPDDASEAAAVYVKRDAKARVVSSADVSNLGDEIAELPSARIAYLRRAPNQGALNWCRGRCSEVFAGNIEGNAACLDYCNCRFRDGFSVDQCRREFYEQYQVRARA